MKSGATDIQNFDRALLRMDNTYIERTNSTSYISIAIELNMKLCTSITFLLITSAQLIAQSDCSSATSVCNFIYDENDSPAGTGNTFEVAPGICQTGGEFNSALYIF
jgi:hypothetical protein